MPAEPWTWPEEVWRSHVDRVRAGRSLAPSSWPGGAKMAVALSFDSDHETIPLRDNETSPGKLSQGEYGARVGVPRIMDLLSRNSIPATFFVPSAVIAYNLCTSISVGPASCQTDSTIA